MKAGDKVRVIGTPPGLKDEGEMRTKTVFERCVGRVFKILAIEDGWLKLEVGQVVGRRPWEEVIWIEPELVEVVKR